MTGAVVETPVASACIVTTLGLSDVVDALVLMTGVIFETVAHDSSAVAAGAAVVGPLVAMTEGIVTGRGEI